MDSIPLGVDFRTYLDEQVAKCDVFLAVIGRDWLKAKGRKGKFRLEDPSDFVRIEIESALKRGIPVIPVLVRGASIPPADRLPASIQEVSYRNGIVVRPDPDFHKDMDRLIAKLMPPVRVLSEPQSETATLTKSPSVGTKHIDPTAPVDMVRVRKGLFLYGTNEKLETIYHDYWIDKYPVTNEKYRAVIEAGGYENQACWSPEGWKWKTEKNITRPAYWYDSKWDKPNHPVVGVSYYEAEAYAKWVGKRLPTEQEWEKAAQGEDGRRYPWGEEFDKQKCNSYESDYTTAVSQYPQGASPYGCYDMAGNVWEWCTRGYDEQKKDTRVIRGGSWGSSSGMLCVSYRDLRDPGIHFTDLGFRLIQDINE